MAIFSGPIESKVQSTATATLFASVGVAVLNAVAAHSELLGNLPPLAQFVILAALPPATTWLAGYVTPHTPRPDMYTYGEPAQPWLPEPPAPVVDDPAPAAPPYQDEPYAPAFNYGEQASYVSNSRGRHRA